MICQRLAIAYTDPMQNSPSNATVTELEQLAMPNVLTYRLTVLVNRLNRQAATILKRHADLRLPEWRCLALLGSSGPLSVAEITTASELDKALISRTVGELARRGLVTTSRDETDRRVLNVRLSSSGKAKFRRTLPIMRRRLADLMAPLTAQEHATMMSAITKLNTAYESWMEAEPDGV